MEHNKESLEAPNEKLLDDVEHLQDRSHLTSLYPSANKQWSGELMSQEDRSLKRSTQIDDISRSIRKRFFLIGFLAPLPFVLLAVFSAASQRFLVLFSHDERSSLYMVPFALALILLIWLTIRSVLKVRKTFYEHAIAVGPFYVTLFALLLPMGVVLYLFTLTTHGNDLLSASLVIGLGVLALSVIFSFLLLFIWTTRFSGRTKMIILLCIGGLLYIAGGAATAYHLTTVLT